jgi:transcriptional regulator with XRE-family HTH domain
MSHFSGRRLHDIRRQRGLSREQLAVRAGMSMSAVTRAEQGHTTPTVDHAAELADALDIQVTDMLDAK